MLDVAVPDAQARFIVRQWHMDQETQRLVAALVERLGFGVQPRGRASIFRLALARLRHHAPTPRQLTWVQRRPGYPATPTGRRRRPASLRDPAQWQATTWQMYPAEWELIQAVAQQHGLTVAQVQCLAVKMLADSEGVR